MSTRGETVNLWRNGPTWWLCIMTHPTPITKERVRRSLNTRSVAKARRLREAFKVEHAAILPRYRDPRDRHLYRAPSGGYYVVVYIEGRKLTRSLRTSDTATARRKRDAILSGRAPIPINQPNQPRLHRHVRLPLAA